MSLNHHLSPAILDYVDRAKVERITFIRRDHFLSYDMGDAHLRELEDLINHPKTNRMPCRALIGDSQSGKTTLLKEFIIRHPIYMDSANKEICHVISVEMPPEPDEGRFWSAVLQSMLIVHNPAGIVEKLEAQAMSELFDLGVKMIIVDEFHNMLHGTARLQRQFLAALKSMVNRLGVVLVVAGTSDVARALASDSQFLTRFEQMALPRWKLNQQFRNLLATFESILPLAEPSDLASREKTIAIFNASGGAIGGVKKIITQAAVNAIESNLESISYTILTDAIQSLNERSMSKA
ncbi:TniB family NTP-binding protein [Undibacterium jejuense]|uniref:TniB family NTP-binding protein n=1 Tax=Undibacterium jejuense TaxID=1344949 RepID=A0A923KP23_9BURK|nr:TniB family NTP-binding protein [Undibacterium jejuense]MBC3862438.1 TniB family NTP-binding protein [Undibacterium jejuense]